MKVSTNIFEWHLKGLIISLKILLQKENAWTLKLVSWWENQGTYQTKEMIKPLRCHSKVFVETFMMKTISFPEGDWYSPLSSLDALISLCLGSSSQSSTQQMSNKTFFVVNSYCVKLTHMWQCELHYIMLRYVMSSLRYATLTIRYTTLRVQCESTLIVSDHWISRKLGKGKLLLIN